MRRTALTIGALAVALALPAVAGAAPAVTNTNDSGPGSLRAAIAGATPGGDTVLVPPGTYHLTSGAIAVGDAITIQGQGGTAAATTITADNHSLVFCMNPQGGDTAVLAKVRISGGNGGGSCPGATGGGGIGKIGAGTLRIEDASITGNSAGSGGGLGSFAGTTQLVRSAIYGNTAVAGANNGGGILNAGTSFLTAENVTISGNAGGGLLGSGGTATLNFVTIAFNSRTGGAGGLRHTGGAMTLSNTVLSSNGGACDGTVTSGGNNAAGGGCGFAYGAGDFLVAAANLGPLTDNGGPTPTHALTPAPDPANEVIEKGNCNGPTVDQRGAPRPDEFGNCDVGAFEFDGRAKAQIPDCTRTGQVPVTVQSPPANSLEAFHYKVAGGATHDIAIPGAPQSWTGSFTVPEEGRHPIEYWGDAFPDGPDGGEFHHHTPTLVVDRTNPTIGVNNPNKFKIFVIKRSVKVNVAAGDSISGLAQDPSGSPTISTAKRGSATYKPTAVDLCENANSAAFAYRVLAPALGRRIVVEELGGSTKVHASQKGQAFKALREPRELRIGSLVDTRKGKIRLTVSKDSRSAIQASDFSGGLFQVLQSRNRRSKGLTEVRLKGGSFRRCARAGKANAQASRRRTIRRLRGNGKGRFRTRGRFSAATVRGTVWTVEDRCDGTLTSVKRGRVAVRDFRRHKTIVLTAGKRYLARP